MLRSINFLFEYIIKKNVQKSLSGQVQGHIHIFYVFNSHEEIKLLLHFYTYVNP